MTRTGMGGFSAVELLLSVSVLLTMTLVSAPLMWNGLDEARTAMAARYLEGRIMDARLHALKRSTRVALRFEPSGGDYVFGEYVDGNGNGVRTTDIAAGIDPERRGPQALREDFAHVSFGVRAGVPDLDGIVSPATSEGVRIGTSRLLTLGPDGTATSGTLYVHGRRGQYAVRVLGATGRTRVLRFDSGRGEWVSR